MRRDVLSRGRLVIGRRGRFVRESLEPIDIERKGLILLNETLMDISSHTKNVRLYCCSVVYSASTTYF